jgi:hypothetical protein
MPILNKSSPRPNCASRTFHRSKRKGLLEQVLHSFLLVNPYRCNECDQRYFRFRLPVHKEGKPHSHAG